jgi:REP element-mobilizing transposase RayT
MASTYLSLYVHIVFATKDRSPTIGPNWMPDLHAYLGGAIKIMEGSPLAIGGAVDHVHILTRLRANKGIAEIVREVKKASSTWATEKYHRFRWQDGYAAFTLGNSDVPRLVSYIRNQEEHHHVKTSAEELRDLLAEHDIEYDPLFFE